MESLKFKFSFASISNRTTIDNFYMKKSAKIKKITKLILAHLLLSLATMFVITIVALTRGIGYYGSIKVVSRELIAPRHLVEE